MKYSQYVKDSEGNLIEVVQETPQKGEKFPTVILVPGFGADYREYGFFDEISDALIKNGFQTMRFSFAGTGTSQGEFVTTTMDFQVQQLRDIIGFAKKDRFTDTRKIGIVGHSFGASVVIAAIPLEDVTTVLFTAAQADPGENLARLFKRQRGFNPNSVSTRELPGNLQISVGSRFWQSLSRYRLIDQIKTGTQSMFFIHGEKDRKVKPWESTDLYSAVKSRKKYVLVEKADHAFTGKYRPVVVSLITDWFTEELQDQD